MYVLCCVALSCLVLRCLVLCCFVFSYVVLCVVLRCFRLVYITLHYITLQCISSIMTLYIYIVCVHVPLLYLVPCSSCQKHSTEVSLPSSISPNFCVKKLSHCTHLTILRAGEVEVIMNDLLGPEQFIQWLQICDITTQTHESQKHNL